MGLFKSIKKRFKKLGSAIAKNMRKLGRGVKKGFSTITKAFGKLGPLGHLALFFIMPGMGNVLTSWMGQFGSTVMNMLPKNFATVLSNVGTTIKDVASFAYDNTVGAVYNTVSKALTAGIDMVTKPFMAPGSEGLATSFKNFVSDTATKFGATPETLSPTEVTEQAKESFADLEKRIDSGAELSKDSRMDAAKEAQAAGEKVTAEAKARAKKLGIGVDEKPTIKTEGVTPDKEPGLFKKIVTGGEGLKTKVAGTEVFGTGVTVGETVSVAKDAGSVFSAYKYFNPDEIDGTFYNPNIEMANRLNVPNDPYTVGGVDATFIPNISTPDIKTAANAYAGMFGAVGPDPISSALNAPGFGYTFENYLTGGNIYG